MQRIVLCALAMSACGMPAAIAQTVPSSPGYYPSSSGSMQVAQAQPAPVQYAAYREQLGLTPPDDAEGCLQDGHWSAGMFGYFPTYALGNILAAQFFAAATRELGDCEEAFARGEFSRLLSWLRQHVHAHGQTFWADELIQEATGGPLSHRWLVEFLTRKYSALYGF